MDEQLYSEVENLIEDIATLHNDYKYVLDKTQLIELSKVAALQEILAELEEIKRITDNIYDAI